MNSVNQMVSDLKKRMDDGSVASTSEKKKKKRTVKINTEISWPVSIFIVLVIGVSLLFTINYFNELRKKELSMQPERFRIPASVREGKPINIVSEDEKLNIAKIDRSSKPAPVQEKAASKKVEVDKSDVKDSKSAKPVPEKSTKDVAKLAVDKEVQKIAKTETVSPKKVVEKKPNEKKKIVKEKQSPKPEKKVAQVVKQTPSKPVVVKKPKASKETSEPVKKVTPKPTEKSLAKKTAADNSKKVPAKPKQKSVPVKKQALVEEKPKPSIAKAEVASAAQFDKTVVPLSNAELAETIYQHGFNLLEDGEIDRAKSLFNKALKEYPPHLKAREAIISIYMNEQDIPSAEKTLKAGVKANRENISLVMWLAQLYMEQDKNSDALKVLAESEKYAKGNGEYFSLLAVSQQNEGQYDQALNTYQKALNIDNRNSRWWLGMGVVFELQSNWTDALSAYTQAINTGQLDAELTNYAEQRLDFVTSQTELAETP